MKPSNKSHNLQFLIVSDFANESNAYRLFASLNAKNLGSDVFIISKPLRHQLGMIYKAANVTIMTSLDLETFGFSTLESLSVKTPVIGYDIGANSELIEQNSLVSIEHPEQIYNKLFEFIESKKKSVVSINVKNYNWSNYAKKLINE